MRPLRRVSPAAVAALADATGLALPESRVRAVAAALDELLAAADDVALVVREHERQVACAGGADGSSGSRER